MKEKKLNLPIIKGPMPGPPILSMSEYLDWVAWCRKNIFDREAYAELKREETKYEVFELKRKNKAA